MKVLVANGHVAGVHGGAEELANNLVTELNRLDHVEAGLLRVPFDWSDKPGLLNHVAFMRQLDLGAIDLLIPLKFPVYHLQAPRRVGWIVHQFRQAYDMHGGPFTYFDDTQEAHDVRAALIEQDTEELAGYDRLFTNSTVTQDRLFSYNGIRSDVLHPPVNTPDLFTPEDYGDFIFVGGRINRSKRQKLVIEALAAAAPDVRVIIAGPSEDANYLAEMQAAIVAHDLADRVRLVPGFHPRDQIVAFNNTCLAAVYIPLDEDSFGYVAMEACQSAKAVVTTTDAGGVVQIVDDGVTGYCTAPDAEALGDALQALWVDKTRTRTMGRASRDKLVSLGLSWDRTLEVLLS